MDKLEKIISLCKCEIMITINPHTSNYQTIPEYLEDCGLEIVDVDWDMLVEIFAYPDTPIGFYKVFNKDLDSALDEMLSILEK